MSIHRFYKGIFALVALAILFFLIFFSPWTSFPSSPRSSPSSAAVGHSPSLVCLAADAQTYDIPGGKCTIYQNCPTGRLSVAMIVQDGRYPESGRRINATCTEAILVLEGSLVVTLGDAEQTLQTGDLVYVTPGTPYSVEGKARAVVFIEPQWDKTQNTSVP